MAGGWEDLLKALLSVGKAHTQLEKLIIDSNKYLGGKAKIPEPNFNIDQLSADLKKSTAELFSEFKKVQKPMLTSENAFTRLVNDCESYRRDIAKSDFGLDPKSKADAKNIALAHKMFEAYFSHGVASWKNAISDLKAKNAIITKVHVG